MSNYPDESWIEGDPLDPDERGSSMRPLTLIASILAAAAVGFIACRLAAADLTIDAVYADDLDGGGEALVTVVNDDGFAYDAVGVECTFTRRGRAVGVGNGAAAYVAAGQSATLTVYGPSRVIDFDAARCRVSFLVVAGKFRRP